MGRIDFSILCIYNNLAMKYIISNPQILGGKPVIVGTRIPIGQILFLLKEGFTLEAINEEYPHISKKILENAVDEAVELVDKNVPNFL